MRTGAELIAEERRRQIEKEGWTAEHDAEHTQGELIGAAICYLAHPSETAMRLYWPQGWAWQWWKPKRRLRNLVRAGALIAAEIDRLQRERMREKP